MPPPEQLLVHRCVQFLVQTLLFMQLSWQSAVPVHPRLQVLPPALQSRLQLELSWQSTVHRAFLPQASLQIDVPVHVIVQGPVAQTRLQDCLSPHVHFAPQSLPLGGGPAPLSGGVVALGNGVVAVAVPVADGATGGAVVGDWSPIDQSYEHPPDAAVESGTTATIASRARRRSASMP
jgi:hypothetical protein